MTDLFRDFYTHDRDKKSVEGSQKNRRRPLRNLYVLLCAFMVKMVLKNIRVPGDRNSKVKKF